MRENANPKGKTKLGDKQKAGMRGAGRKVVAEHANELETKEFLGYSWPLKLWKKHNPGKKLPKKQLVFLEHMGSRLKGIILDDTAGKPIGVIEVNNKSRVTVVRKAIVAESDSELDDDVDEAYSAASKRLQRTSAEASGSQITGARTLGALKKEDKSFMPCEHN